MKHLFVPQDIALMAKGKGFDEECFAYYETPKTINFFDTKYGSIIQPIEMDGLSTSAPLYQQLIDWFRNKHGIVIWIETAPYARTFNFRFYIETSDNRLEGNKSKDYYKVYNEALIEGFKLIK